MSKIYNWGIVGLGKIAHKFAQDLQTIPNARIWAVAAKDQTRADDFAATYKATHAFGTYEAMLDCPDLDIIYIATPHSSHCALASLYLSHKIPCLVEKPFGINRAEAQLTFDIAKQNQTFVMEALWTRFLPQISQTLAWIADDKIGAIKSIKSDFGFHLAHQDGNHRLLNPDLGGGSLLDVGIYPIFMTYLLLGKPTAMQSMAHIGNTGVDESFVANFKYKDKALAMIHSSVATLTETETIIYGEKGNIKLHGRFHEACPRISLHLYDGTSQHIDYEWNTHGYNYEAIAVMECLNQGLIENSLWTPQNTLDILTIMDALRAQIGLTYKADL